MICRSTDGRILRPSSHPRPPDPRHGAIKTWMKTHGRPVYLWETRDLAVSTLDKVWQGDGVYIYQFVARRRVAGR